MVKKSKNSPPEMDIPAKSPCNWWVRGTSETCAFFDVSAETLSNWEKRGAPKEGYGKWDIRKLMEWKYGAAAGESSNEARRLAADAKYKEAKAAQETIKLAIVERKYIPTGQVNADLKRLFTVLKQSFLAIGHKIATEMNTIDPQVALIAKKVVDDVVQDALQQISKTGHYKR